MQANPADTVESLLMRAAFILRSNKVGYGVMNGPKATSALRPLQAPIADIGRRDW
jgi:hypothetical protein